MKKVEFEKWRKYFEARQSGLDPAAAARRARISPSTAFRFERGDQASSGLEAAAELGITHIDGNLLAQPLSPEALKALEDFSYFRLRYFGRKSTPWQERAAYEIIRRLHTPDKEYVVMNEPPGAGKSTLFTHDIPVWLIVRDRTIRIQLGSHTERQARMYATRIKKSLERDVPLRASSDDIEAGRAWDAEACLQDDFGAFKPEGRTDVWRSEGFTVRQLDGVALDDKEPTVSAWGKDSRFLGGRFDFIVWDDLIDRKNVKTVESKEELREWWDIEGETRLEPGGMLLLQGQRIANNDLYRYCLDKKNLDESPKYSHVVYKAHDTDLCKDDHGPDAKPWPEGCLLDPFRLPWKMLEQTMFQDPRTFNLVYQQTEGTDGANLIDPAWIDGGVDADGYYAPGCRDDEREVGEIPPHLMNGEGWSFITVDPSPTEFWGIIWWVYDPDTDRRYIIDLWRQRMNPEQFLSFDLNDYTWSGLLPELWQEANDIGCPITHVIFEVNAAQRWFLSQPSTQKWQEVTGMTIVPHTTHINKKDPKYGFESIGDLFRQGMIRLPYATPTSRLRMGWLVHEATSYPDGDTDDVLMSVWFQKLAVENHYAPRQQGLYRMDRPTFMRRSYSRGIA